MTVNYERKLGISADLLIQEWGARKCSANGHKNCIHLKGKMDFGANYLYAHVTSTEMLCYSMTGFITHLMEKMFNDTVL
jgi:hypothetical protein